MFSSRAGYFMWEDHRISTFKGTRGGTAISISACDDHQNSGDTTVSIRIYKLHTYSYIDTKISKQIKKTTGKHQTNVSILTRLSRYHN